MKQFVFYTNWIWKWPIIISSLLLLAVCLTWTGPLTVAHADTAPEWDGNSVQYTVGDEVTYNGNLYRCLQSHTSLPTWDPVDAPSLWQRISSSSQFVDSHFSASSFADSHSTQWSGDSVQYNVGDKVTYNGNLYKCLQSHTSLPTWDPMDAPSLWQRISSSSGHHPRRKSQITPASSEINSSFINSNTYYYIFSQTDDSRVLDIQNNSTALDTPIIAYPQNGQPTDNQLWRFVPDNNGDGYSFIESKSGMFLDIQGNVSTSRTPVIAYSDNSEHGLPIENQLWKFSNGYIQSRLGNLVLDIKDDNPDKGAIVIVFTKNRHPVTDNQRWTLVPASQIA
jgi:chitodextrinase